MSQPQFMAPIVEWLIGVLKGAELGELEAFGEVRKSWTGVAMNWPPVAVMPRTSQFDPEISGASHSQNAITIKFGVNGSDPDDLTDLAMAYMLAIDAAIEAAAPLPQISHVHIGTHDYGPLYTGNSGGFFRFPELHLEVEVYE